MSKTNQLSLRWPNPRGIGVLYVRGHWLWTQVGDGHHKQLATGLRWPPADDPLESKIGTMRVTKLQREMYDEGMKILQQRALEHLHPELVKLPEPLPEPPVLMTLLGAIAEFKEAMFKGYSPSIRTRFRIAFNHFLSNQGDTDFYLSYDTLAERLIKNNNRCRLAPETKRKVMEKLRTFLAYCLERHWIPDEESRRHGLAARNPIGAIGGVPTVERDEEDIRIWEPAEVARQVKWFSDNEMPINALELRFTYRTGLREGEVCRLRWSDFRETDGRLTEFRIEGKRAGRKGVDSTGKPYRERWFPLYDSEGREWIPGLVSIIDELRGFQGRYGDYCFPWRDIKDLQIEYRICRIACGHDDGRTHKHFRKSAFAYWEDRLHLPDRLMTDLAGNTVDVWLKHYRRHKRKASQLAEQVSHHAKRNDDGSLNLPF